MVLLYKWKGDFMLLKDDKLSLYRKEIMGVAIILIMISHNTMDFPGFLHNINSGIKMLCQVGVDLFFFYSGYGCFFSMKRNRNALLFYKKRIVRLIPAYLVVCFLFSVYRCIVYGNSVKECIWNYSLISFYTDAVLTEWFIAAIIVMYLLFPLIFALVDKKEIIAEALVLILVTIVVLAFFGITFLRGTPRVVLDIFGSRVPAFLIGTIMAKRSLEGKKVNRYLVALLAILGIISCAACLYMYKVNIRNYWTAIRTLFIFVGALVIIIWVLLREKSKGGKASEKISGWMAFLGGITLEIYLTHEKILAVTSDVVYHFINQQTYALQFVINVLAVVISIFAAYCLKRIIDVFFKKKTQ